PTPTATPTMNPRTLAVMNEAAVKIATATRNQNLAVRRSLVSLFFIQTLYQMKLLIRPAGGDQAEYPNRPASFDTLVSLAYSHKCSTPNTDVHRTSQGVIIMAKDTETTTEQPTDASSTDLVGILKERTGKDVEQQNLRATLRNLVKKGVLVHEPRTRWAFDKDDVETVVAHYSKSEAEQEEAEGKPAKKASKGKAAKKDEAPAEEPAEDDDDLELEDI